MQVYLSVCFHLWLLYRLCRMPWRDTFKANLISDDAWMDMLKVRNELAHDYDYEIVKKHCNTIVEKYIDLFYEFEKTVKKLY